MSVCIFKCTWGVSPGFYKGVRRLYWDMCACRCDVVTHAFIHMYIYIYARCMR